MKRIHPRRLHLRRLGGALAVASVLGASLLSTTSAQTAPTAVDDAATVAEDQSITINVLANDTPAGVTIASVGTPTKGTAATTVGGIVYTPKPDYHGTASFDYTITDGTATDTATVTVTITPVNDAPVAKDDEARTTVNAAVAIKVLKNDKDVDGDTLTPVIVTQPANGTATVDATTKVVTYTPQAGFLGTNTFTYYATDGALNSNVVTVTVKVKEASSGDASLNARVVAACETHVGPPNGVQALCRLYLGEPLPAFVKVKIGEVILKQTKQSSVSAASICARSDNSVRVERLCEVYEGDLLPKGLKKQVARLIVEAATGTASITIDNDDDDKKRGHDHKPWKAGKPGKHGKPWR